jgi:hypothetical protein
LNIRFNSAVKDRTRSQTETTIDNGIKEAARCYKDKPILKIHPGWKWNVKGVFNNFPYGTGRELKNFMHDKFKPIVGKWKAEGWI